MKVLRAALFDSIPAFCAYFPLGIVYGYLFTEAGNPSWLAPIYSLFIFAGAVQFLALSLLASGATFLALAFGTLTLALRNTFYGIPLVSRYKESRLLKWYLAFGLVDATFALVTAKPPLPKQEDRRYLIALTAVIHLYWVVGTSIGAFLGEIAQLPKGMEFALTALFVVMSIEKLKAHKNVYPLVIVAIAVSIALALGKEHLFLIATLLSLLFCLVLPQKKESYA